MIKIREIRLIRPNPLQPVYFDEILKCKICSLPVTLADFQITVKRLGMMLNPSKTNNNGGALTLLQGDNGPVITAVMRMVLV